MSGPESGQANYAAYRKTARGDTLLPHWIQLAGEFREAFETGVDAGERALAEAFAAGLRPAPELDLASDEARPGEVDATLATVPPCDEISPWGLRCRAIRAHETHRDRDGNRWPEQPAPALAEVTAERNVLRGTVALREAELERVRKVIDGFTANPEVAELLPAGVIASLRRRTGLPARAST